MNLLFAATYPSAPGASCSYGSFPRVTWAPGSPFGRPKPRRGDDMLEGSGARWGKGVFAHPPRASLAANGRRAVVFAVSNGGRRARARRGSDADDLRDRYPLRFCRDTRTDAVLHRRDEPTSGRRRTLRGGAGCRGRGSWSLPGTGPLPLGRGRRRVRGRDRGVSDGERAGPPRSDRVLATVLFTDIVGSTERAARARRPPMADLLESFYGDRAATGRPLPRSRGRHGGRRLLRHLRRPGGRSVAPSRSATPCALLGLSSHRPPHGRMRGLGDEGRRHRRAHRRSSRGVGRPRRDPRLGDRQGSRRRLWYRLPEPWRPCAEGRPGSVAAVTPWMRRTEHRAARQGPRDQAPIARHGRPRTQPDQ